MFFTQGQDLHVLLCFWVSCKGHLRCLAQGRKCSGGSRVKAKLLEPCLLYKEKAAATSSILCTPVNYSLRRTRDLTINLSLLNQCLFLEKGNKLSRDLQKTAYMKQWNLNIMTFWGSGYELHLLHCIPQTPSPKECQTCPRNEQDPHPLLTSQPSHLLDQ